MISVLLLAGSLAAHAPSFASDTTRVVAGRDTLKSTYTLDSAYLPSLLPDVIFSFGLCSINGLSGINPIFRARDRVLAAEGYSVQTTLLNDASSAASGEWMIPINQNVDVIADLAYIGDYSSACAGLTLSVPIENVVLVYFGGEYGVYHYNRVVDYAAFGPSDPNGGYTMLDNVTYSFTSFGERAMAGFEFAPRSFIGFNLYAAYNKVNASTDADTKAVADPTGYEFGLRLSFHFWKANTPREGQ